MITKRPPQPWDIQDFKKDNYRRYEAGEYGNKLRSWSDFARMMHDGPAVVVPRYAGTGGAVYPRYGQQIPLAEAEPLAIEWIKLGAERGCLNWNEGAPDTKLRIQGEVCRTHEGLQLFWSDEKTTMRKALAASGRQDSQLTALMLLQRNLFPWSYVELVELMDRHPDSVVEFGAYGVALGCIPRRNTIIWEVRMY